MNTKPCGCTIILRTGEILDSSQGDRPCADISRIDLCPLHKAAPDLLAELESAIFYIETYGGEVTASFAAGGNLARVKAAIAKAKGVQ